MACRDCVSHCDLNQMETELHFLTECSKYTDIRRSVLRQNTADPSHIYNSSRQEKLAYLLGEHKTCCVFAAQYVSLCHHRREDTPPERERERETERERERERRREREIERERERERETCCVFAAQYVSLCHHRREDTPSALS